jgi:23S rRNA (cytosine1962-C5)-methyltransferase
MDSVILKPGREKSLRRYHPWVYSGAVATLHGNPAVGDTVVVRASNGDFLAYGAYSPHSQIRIRVWTWNPDVVVAPEFFRTRLQAALNYRLSSVFTNAALFSDIPSSPLQPRPSILTPQSQVTPPPASALRLVNAESDGLPGLVADRYGDTLVIQVLSAGAERWYQTFADLLMELTAIRDIFERSDVDARALEGLSPRVGSLRGNPPDSLIISEHGLRYQVSLRSGHKTGFYLDQSRNRWLVRYLAGDREVLDCFAYTGGFSLNALAGGAAAVLAIDSSAAALELAQENLRLNALPADRFEPLVADVFQQLRKFRDMGRKFDMVILDPPKFAPTASQAHKASRGYKDINLLALKLLRPGGFLVTFSCSGGVSPALFAQIVASAALDAGVNTRIVTHLEQSPDHPVALNFPEGAYLKGLVLRVNE